MSSASPDQPLRVLLVDDDPVFRELLAFVLRADAGAEIVGQAADGARGVELARECRPDVVVMDLRMPQMDGIEATRRICALPTTANVRVLILTMFDLDAYVYASLRAGASGFLLKDTPPADLLTAIRVVATGEALLAPSVTRRLIAEFTKQAQPSTPVSHGLSGVTEREREILRLIGRGLSNTEIAEHLRLSIATVKTHVSRLLAKTQARDRAQLVIIAYETRLVAVSTERW